MEQLQFAKSQELEQVLKSLMNSFIKLADLLRNCSTDGKELSTKNKFGDTQLDTDVASDEIIFSELKKSGQVAFALSEERPETIEINGEDKPYIVTFDPLDGSSIIGPNFTVGTIFGIWRNCDKKLIGHKLSEQITSGAVMYGSRTTVVFWNEKQEKVQEYTLKQEQWILTQENIKIAPKGNIFAPGNMRACAGNPGYQQCLNYWLEKAYTLRYTGGMVPDIYHIFIKQKGVFSNLSCKKHPAKLRVLYEVGPMAFLVEKAGGKASLGHGPLLDLVVTGYDQRTDIICGSVEEVEICEKIIQGQNQQQNEN